MKGILPESVLAFNTPQSHSPITQYADNQAQTQTPELARTDDPAVNPRSLSCTLGLARRGTCPDEERCEQRHAEVDARHDPAMMSLSNTAGTGVGGCTYHRVFLNPTTVRSFRTSKVETPPPGTSERLLDTCVGQAIIQTVVLTDARSSNSNARGKAATPVEPLRWERHEQWHSHSLSNSGYDALTSSAQARTTTDPLSPGSKVVARFRWRNLRGKGRATRQTPTSRG
jgi:hypothetical protein